MVLEFCRKHSIDSTTINLQRELEAALSFPTIVLAVGPPCWAKGLACPSLDGLDPTQEADELLARATEWVRADGAGMTVALVGKVFALLQLAVDDRPGPGSTATPSPAEKVFRTRLAEKTRNLAKGLAEALQPREVGSASGRGGDGGGVDEREVVVLAAKNFSSMAHVMMERNNTSALLIAHNGLAKLVSARLPLLLGGVIDASRLLSQLYSICRDGLDQLEIQLAGTEKIGEAGAEEAKQANKFGRLLANFCTLMACLLRHLGSECLPHQRQRALRLLAKACAVVAYGVFALRRAGRDSKGAGTDSSLFAVVARRLYPQVKEAFLSTAKPAPCRQGSANYLEPLATSNGRSDADGARIGKSQSRGDALGQEGCRCYPTSANNRDVEAAQRKHDPWDAVSALRPPPQRPESASKPEVVRGPDRNPRAATDEAAKDPRGDEAPHPLGSVLLLCELLRCDDRLSETVTPRFSECCTWVTEHLSALFPGWVTVAASAEVHRDGAAANPAIGIIPMKAEVMAGVCDEAAEALAAFVTRRSLEGRFKEAQVQLVEGCVCHPHPLCRDIWCDALQAFLRNCDATAQVSCVRTFVEASLDRRVSARFRHRFAHALAVVCASPRRLGPGSFSCVRQSCLSRIRGCGSSGDGGGGGGGGGVDSGCGACVLDFLADVPVLLKEDRELRAASIEYALNALAMWDASVDMASAEAGASAFHHQAGRLAAAARFFCVDYPPETSVGDMPRSRASSEWLRDIRDARKIAGRKLEVIVNGKAFAVAVGAGPASSCLAQALGAIVRLVAQMDKRRVLPICSIIIDLARKRTADGAALLALTEGLKCMGRQPFPQANSANYWTSILQDGFTVLFGSASWPVIMAAMQALEVMARHADPKTAELLPRLVPAKYLPAFKARLARRTVTLDGGKPVELSDIEAVGLEESETLLRAARVQARATARLRRKGIISSGGTNGRNGHDSPQEADKVILREGDKLDVIEPLLSRTISKIEAISKDEGGGVCLTLGRK